MSHPDHSKELARINRIIGQLEGVKKMVQESRYCPDILTQLKAIRSATHSIEANILEAHLESCVSNTLQSCDEKDVSEKIAELKEIFKRFGSK